MKVESLPAGHCWPSHRPTPTWQLFLISPKISRLYRFSCLFSILSRPRAQVVIVCITEILSVDENEKAVIWLLENVFNDLPIPFLVAGKNPGPKLRRAVARFKNCCLVSDPSDQELKDIISKAQIHVSSFIQLHRYKIEITECII